MLTTNEYMPASLCAANSFVSLPRARFAELTTPAPSIEASPYRARASRRHPSSASSARRGMLNSFPYGIRESWTFRIESVAFVPRSHDLWFETVEALGSGRRRGAAVHSKSARAGNQLFRYGRHVFGG